MDLIQSRTVDQSPEPTTIMVLEPGIASIFWRREERSQWSSSLPKTLHW